MQDRVVERHAINEGLERRSRRPVGVGQIDMPGSRIVEVIHPADLRQDASAAIFDNHHGKVCARREVQELPAGKCFKCCLQIAVQGGADALAGA